MRAERLGRAACRLAVAVVAAATGASVLAATAAECSKPVYLTFDTGHMGVAPLVADVLKRHDVHVTFFAAAERTKDGGDSLDDHWAPWWQARAADGDEFASHTYDHAYWRADLPDENGQKRFTIQPSAGPQTGQRLTWTAAQYCQNIRKSSERLAQITGKKPLPLYRAPGGKTSPKLLEAARACGYMYVGWSPAGFLGDELPSDKYPNQKLLAQALERIRPGDVLLAHLGIWSRQDPWAPAVLEPLVTGLQQRGFCFRTLRDHPDYRAWIAAHP
ncbi:polysaccharide deacetylase family protein [Pseudacidovorax intermedius]|uniref:Peptidoglycan/xylan/chitin deacetylase (PgdA/CDA1 family) n=1 Tax=Pseudacidovorax intermedius TaxID=433924 RepID=A0A370FAR8_9BURK|nr:polysaccharide deacetylase family protein [Pseudacidovorax intermedius]RDI21420.1 peptidoglycan/xylan/chitin deacetylase (PgdA/CDA1 family) [Pseudacidovorax intermedius]